jgi:hypothetical protein
MEPENIPLLMPDQIVMLRQQKGLEQRGAGAEDRGRSGGRMMYGGQRSRRPIPRTLSQARQLLVEHGRRKPAECPPTAHRRRPCPLAHRRLGTPVRSLPDARPGSTPDIARSDHPHAPFDTPSDGCFGTHVHAPFAATPAKLVNTPFPVSMHAVFGTRRRHARRHFFAHPVRHAPRHPPIYPGRRGGGNHSRRCGRNCACHHSATLGPSRRKLSTA